LTNTVTSTGAANTTGALTLAATVTTLNIDATTNLTTGAVTNTAAAAITKIDIDGAGVVDLDAAAFEATVKTIDASGNSGGVKLDLGSLVTQTVTGSTGNDTITAGNVLTTGSVDAGAGTDTLIVDDATFINTAALGLKYTNFETLSVSGISQDASLVSGITQINVAAATSKSITALTAAQAASINVTGNQATASTFALTTATGTSDVLGLNLGTGLTTSSATSLNTSLVVTGFETLNLTTNQGPSATAANSVSTVGAITGATLANITLKGGGFSIADAATTLATTINGSDLTGVLTVGGNVIAGTTVTGGAGADVFTAGTNNGATYTGNAGNDKLTATVAQMVATGTNDTTFAGGAGTDTLAISDTANTTITDNHFTAVTGIETLTLAGTNDISLTTGSSFNTAVDGKVTITDGITGTTDSITYALGLATDDITITSSGGAQVGDVTTENVSITTGSGDDTVTFSATSWVGAVGASALCTISTGAGNDTITHTVGTILAVTGAAPAVITGGTGKDTITSTHVNATSGLTVTFAVAAGDSLSTAYDEITGFDLATAALDSDTLDFTGTSTVGTLGSSTDSGVVKSHSINGGVVIFDDAATYNAELIINAGNLADAVGYLNANSASLETFGFAFDSTGDGANDASMIFNQNTTDSLVMLAGTTSLNDLITTNADTLNDCFIT
jgi:hypothetical protein